jgi:subtilase family serine protease
VNRRLALLGAAALVLSSAATAGVAVAAPAASGVTHRNVPVCAGPERGYAACMSLRHETLRNGKPVSPAAATPSGYFPADIQAAYGLPVTALATNPPSGPWVAIVDAYDLPTAENDLNVYRTQFGLPPCTTANGCFKKVNQNGAANPLPRKDGGWGQEIALDMDMVSAACPNCRILLVEAKSASFSNLATAVNTAADPKWGVKAISNSYGGSDYAQSSIPGYDHPGIAITASTGDNGYGMSSPASFKTVIAVGGTSLSRNGSGFTETAWSGAGSGCSTKNAKPQWQDSSVTGCSGRASADVSAVADPQTGVAVYDSTSYAGYVNWMVFGGTSASAPIIAAVYAMGGNLTGYPASYTYAHTASLHDVTSGSNGTCSTTQWCNARSGWDGPTGLGTPNGTSAF